MMAAFPLAQEVDAIETEVKTMEKNVTKINAILSSMDSESTSGEEQLQYCQVNTVKFALASPLRSF